MNAPKLDAVVVGAGFAGVSAARNLADSGLSVAILEASSRVGGRTYARPFRGPEDLVVDLGGSWINRELQPLMRREIDRYGAALNEDLAPENATFLRDGLPVSAPVSAASLAELERAATHLRDAAKRVSTALPLTQQPIRDLDVSVDDFFAPLRLSQETREFIYGYFVPYTGCHPKNASMLFLIAQTAAFGYSAYGFYGALTERFVGGTSPLLEKMIARSGVQLHLSSHVIRVEQGEDGVTVHLRTGTVVGASACIMAVPTNVLRHIKFAPQLSDNKRALIASNHLGRSYKPIILVDGVPRRPIAYGWGRLTMMCVGYELDAGRYLLIGFGAEDIDRFDPTDRDAVEQAVRAYYPAAHVVACDAHDWNADPLFDGTWRVDAAGTAFGFLEGMNIPEKRVVFAGTDVDDSVWRTWMEGALSSGYRAADRIHQILAR